MYTYVPDLIRYYLGKEPIILGKEPIIANVDTWRLEDPGALEEMLDRLGELIVKPVDGSGTRGSGPRPATGAELDALRAVLMDDPRGWIAQPIVQLSIVGTTIGDRLQPRHVDLQPFAVNDGDRIWVLPGGLTRVALPEGELVINNSQGGGSKDTGVIGCQVPVRPHSAAEAPRAVPQGSQVPIDAHPDDVRPQAMQQQQQQQDHHQPQDRQNGPLWEAVNGTWNQLPAHLHAGQPHDFFRWVRERAAVVAGIVDSATARYDRWQYLGLRRSIVHALSQAERRLDALEPPSESAAVSKVRLHLGPARTRLAHSEPEEVLLRLPVATETVLRACSAASDAIRARHFPSGAPTTRVGEAL